MNIFPKVKIKFKKGKYKSAPLKSSTDVAEVFRLLFDKDTIGYTESAVALFVNISNEVIAWKLVSQGGIAGTVMDPRTIFVTALNVGATAFFVAHNHPSGKLKPSDADIRLTRQLSEGGQVLEIRLLDHIILTESSYYSFADNGQL